LASSIDELAREINRRLEMYTGSVTEDVNKAAEEVAKAGVAMLKSRSPKLTTDYSKGWKAKKVKGKWVVHNATDYQLIHLLERGHATRDGGRTRAIVHVKPVEEEIINDFEDKVRRSIQQ